MQRNQIEQAVLNVLEAFLKCQLKLGDEISRQNTADWDSLKHMEIMFALEEELGVEFSEEELAKLDSAVKIVDAVLAKHAA
ncbi:acyl carrier protein [Geobacter sp. SVR]|uniref:acyl carrier protein n=1 Tax=Geobacter sp. SVR TaxID=2495594 RepID=UPI00143EFB24|nr:acyl carrier protein [Geobacter sp. SVR]BCS55001.1 hypothetical protein GSVR_33090 [Geobacter sp. SVR]GCF85183.1 acyl carrier protein [Geobacter sp. SVR]